ncbi:DNA polymerase III subunit gamma/tau [Oceanicoccus sp. KOV_DT_Chl]|uniref:DNA polymerase III subunit gamma/tau n=1 Tax=Oceanicoccus sp. KOV_DT_Chl TaxID=1904639 RepID=UPI000C7D3505|nr:DNA polymerase III subunit gamma/tau [Oceanicoccus sp. KOV_DT_Chl]
MSYQVLARKWRPKTFREMVGQEHVLKALINALDHNRLHHAYLFTGTRGVGKTTIARILAKCLNCEAGVSSEPCGQCGACASINEGRFIDLIEVDAASRTKVEDTRELLENVQYAPTVGRYKVYLIDEVHMLSTHSFNALLKTLEEPPPHVKFLLATTDPQKLPATILSRCLQFNLKNMSPERIVGHLQYVLEQEMVGFDDPALWLLGRAADGSMRDAMSLADQAISFGSGKLQEADVRNMLGSIDQTAVYDILEALASLDGAQILAAVARLSEHAPDYGSALEELLTLLHRVAIAQAVPDATDNSFGDREQVMQLAARLAAEDVQLFYQLGINGRRDLPLAPDPRSGFEMVLLRMLAFKPAGIPELPQVSIQNSDLSQPPVSSEAPQPTKKSEAPLPPAAITPAVVEAEPESVVPAAAPAPAIATVAAVTETVVAAKPARAELQVAVEVPAAIAIAQQPKSDLPESISLQNLTPENWSHAFEQLGFGGVVGNIASHCVLQKIDGDHVHLLLDENNATLFNESYSNRIESHLAVTLNAPIKLTITVGVVAVETPSILKERLKAERRQQALVSLQNDPNIQVLINQFGAELDEQSVEPI